MGDNMINPTDQPNIYEGEIQGHKFVAKLVRPYGFWTINNAAGGDKPKELDSVFTSRERAELAFRNYVNRISARVTKKEPVKEV